jgi:hypothetical protein
VAIDGPTQATTSGPDAGKASWVISYTINREVTTATLGWNFNASFFTVDQFRFRGIELVDAGTFALERQIAFENRLKALRGMTTDIDLSTLINA